MRCFLLKSLVSTLLLVSVLMAQEKQSVVPQPVAPQTTPPAPPTASIIPERENTVVGWLDVIPFTSKIFHNTRMLRVWVPGNYLSPHNAHRKYPVLYMQDGQNLFDKATAFAGEWQMDETADHLIGSFKIGQMFIVGIDNAGDQRGAEYLPYPDPHNPQSPTEKELRGKEYAKFLMTEVMPFLERRYRIATGAANTGIGGSSYGAVASLYAALEHPAVFGHVLIESPPLWVGDGQLLKDAEKAKLLPQKMYIGVGTAESEDLKSSGEEVKNVQDLEKILRAKGMGETRLKVVVEEHATHNEGAWARRLATAMLFLYGRSN
jgi:predicted alpha/beta superfamily hydrolase